MKAARVEAKRAMSTYTFAAVEARKLAGEMVPMDAAQAGEGKLAFTLREPIGIVAAISPFNFPLNLVAHKLAPAFAAGCAVVLKPAGHTPLSALLLAELEEEAGLPPGWLNVVVGPSAEIGDVLVEDERVKAISFTGSGPVGWGLKERAPKKRVALELGNATPVIVAADADLDAAVDGDGREQLLLRGPELHLRAAALRGAPGVRRVRRAVHPEGRGARRRRPGRRGDRRRPRDRRGREDADPRVDRGGPRGRRRRARRRRGAGRPDPADGDRECRSRPEGELRRGLRPGRDAERSRLASTRRSSSRTRPASGSRPGSSRARSERRCAPPASSSSAA